MKRLDLYRAKLKATRSELRHKQSQYNAAWSSMARSTKLIQELEKKIETLLAKT